MLTGREYGTAIEGGLKVLEMDRTNGLARWLLTTAYERKGDFPKAIDLQEETSVLYGETKESAARRFQPLRRAYQSQGSKGYWRTNLEQYRSEWKRKPGEPYHLAALYSSTGDRQNASFGWKRLIRRALRNLLIG